MSRQFHRTLTQRKSVQQFQRYAFDKVWQPSAHPPRQTGTTIPLQHRGLRGKNHHRLFPGMSLVLDNVLLYRTYQSSPKAANGDPTMVDSL